VVWDISPLDKLIRFVITDEEDEHRPSAVNSWEEEKQNPAELSACLANVLRKRGRLVRRHNDDARPSGGAVLSGLALALENLCELTPRQNEIAEKRSLRRGKGPAFANRGRIVLVTNFKDESHVSHVIQSLQQMLEAKNEAAFAAAGGISGQAAAVAPIDQLSLEIVHSFVDRKDANVSNGEHTLGYNKLIIRY